MVISSDGTVYPCCYWNSYNNSGNPACGNTNDQTIDEIWNGEVYQDLRKHMAAGDLEAAGCKNCLAVEQGASLNLRWNRDAKAEEPAVSAYAQNIKLKRKEIRDAETVLESTPTVISLTPSEHCNLRCLHCYQDTTRGLAIRRGSLDDEIMALIPTMSEMIAGGGEPLLLPIWRRFINEYQADDNPYLQLSMSTNATYVTESILEGMAAFPKLGIIVSFDGATKDVYESVRLRGDFDEVMTNVEALVDLVNTKPESTFAFTYCVMKANFKGLPELLRMCTDRRLHYNLMPVMTWPIDQSIRCFNNPAVELVGWRTALDAARQIFEAEYIAKMDLAEPDEDALHVPWYEGGELLAARGHFDALDAAIPWELLDVEHHRVATDVPSEIFDEFRFAVDASWTPSVSGERLHQVPYFAKDLLVAVFDLVDDQPGEIRYYAPLNDDGSFEVHLPAGEYVLMPCPRNQAPGYVRPLTWRISVAASGAWQPVGDASSEVAVAISAGFTQAPWGLDWRTAEAGQE